MLKEKFASLPSREQRILLVATPIIVILLLWLTLIKPALNNHQSLQQRIIQKSADLAWMQQAAYQLNSHPTTTLVNSGISLRQSVTKIFTQQNINLNRIQTGSNDEISVWADNVSFNSLLMAIQDISQQGLDVSQAQISRTDQEGIVNVRLTLAQTGGS